VIRGTTRVAAVLGWPVTHTKSPALLNAAFAATSTDAVLVPMGVPPADLAAAVAGLRAIRMLGASVTVPHKLAVMPLCDELSASARAVGAVNCLQLEDDRLVGHNTDEGGFLDGLLGAGFDLKGKRAVILGAGGAARAVAYGLRGGRAIEVIARQPATVSWAVAWPWTAENLRDTFARADVVIDTTPVGLESGSTEDAWLDALPLDALRPGAWVASLIYHRRPGLLERAAKRGHVTLDGRAMLLHQGARAFTSWTGQPAPLAAMRNALDASIGT